MKFAVIFCIVPCIMILAACFSPYTGEEGTGSISISIGGGNNRAILAWDTIDSDILEHEVTLTDSQGVVHPTITIPSAASGGGTANFVSLPLGPCTIYAEGKDSSMVKSVGTLSVTIAAGSNGTKAVIMGPPEGWLGMRITQISNTTFTPIVNPGASPAYSELVNTFTVEVFGFLNDSDANSFFLDTPTVSMAGHGLTFSGFNSTGDALNGIKTFTVTANYDGTGAVAGGTADIEIDILGPLGTYSYSGGPRSIEVTIANGQTTATAIPVTDANFVHFGAYAGTSPGRDKNYKLTEDVSVTNWDPIGDNTNSFIGAFDGQGNSIDFNNINAKQGIFTQFNIGLFSVLGGPGVPGSVKNLKLTGTITGTFNSTNDIYAGAVVGFLENGTIENISSGVNITLRNNAMLNVGGIVGFTQTTGLIQNCYTTGPISAGSYNSALATSTQIGGIVGESGVGNTRIENCWSSATLTATLSSSGPLCVGGIVGIISSGSQQISRCVALNNSIIDNSGAFWTFFGRTVGNYVAGFISDCFGLTTMAPGGWSPGAATKDGADVTGTQADTYYWWTSPIGGGPVWALASNKVAAENNYLLGSGPVLYHLDTTGARPKLWFD